MPNHKDETTIRFTDTAPQMKEQLSVPRAQSESFLRLRILSRNTIFAITLLAILASCSDLSNPNAQVELKREIYKTLSEDNPAATESTFAGSRLDETLRWQHFYDNQDSAAAAPEETMDTPPEPKKVEEDEPTPPPTPEPELREPGFFLGGIDLTSENITFEFITDSSDSPFNGLTITFNGAEYPREPEAAAQFLATEYAQGKGTAAVTLDQYHNVVMFLHSGYDGYDPLEGEELRDLMQGGGKFTNWTMFSEAEAQQRMESIKGSIIRVTANGRQTLYKVLGSFYVPNDEVAAYEADTATMPNEIVRLTGDDLSPYQQLLDFNEKEGIISWCFWGPPDAQDRTIYARGGLIVEPFQ